MLWGRWGIWGQVGIVSPLQVPLGHQRSRRRKRPPHSLATSPSEAPDPHSAVVRACLSLHAPEFSLAEDTGVARLPPPLP